MLPRPPESSATETGNPNKKREAPNSSPSRRMACDMCRERKVRCDREDPCGRCTRLGYDCSYQGRKRYRAAQADMPRQLSQLQDRLAQTEVILMSSSSGHAQSQQTGAPQQLVPQDPSFEGLEMLANLTEDIPDFGDTTLDEPFSTLTPDILPPLPGSSHIATPLKAGEIPTSNLSPPCPPSQNADEGLSPQDLATLRQNYFGVFYSVLHVLSKPRFLEEQAYYPTAPRVCALSYGVALVGTTISSKYAHLQDACYRNARKYVELCERDDDETNLTSLNIFQALLFIIRYELTKRHFIRAWRNPTMLKRKSLPSRGLLTKSESSPPAPLSSNESDP